MFRCNFVHFLHEICLHYNLQPVTYTASTPSHPLGKLAMYMYQFLLVNSYIVDFRRRKAGYIAVFSLLLPDNLHRRPIIIDFLPFSIPVMFMADHMWHYFAVQYLKIYYLSHNKQYVWLLSETISPIFKKFFI